MNQSEIKFEARKLKVGQQANALQRSKQPTVGNYPESQRSQWAAKIDTEHAKDETLFEVFKAMEAKAES